MSGIECAGLLLAVLPLAIQAAKLHKHVVDTVLDALSNSRRDDKLEEFYEELWWELFVLDRQLRDTVQALPFLKEDRKVDLLKAENMNQWVQRSDVMEALHEYFNSEADVQAFLVIMGKIVQLLAQIMKDSTVDIDRKELPGMYRKLRAFEEQRRKQMTSSSAKERIRFCKKEKARKSCLKALRTWNKNLLCLTEEAHREPFSKKAPSRPSTTPSPQLREFSRILYKALARYWRCTCATPHQAQICLRPRESASHAQSPSDFDFLFSTSPTVGQTHVSWMEGTVLLRPAEEARKYERAALDQICDALRKSMSNHCLNFLIKQDGHEPTLWQLRPQPKRSRILHSVPAVTLQSLLYNSHRLPLITKRKLAVILARPLLQLHEGLWLGKEWDKRQITFFYESIDTIDYQRPYVATRFDASDQKVPEFDLFHRNASILALGILLIEIHTGKPIETYRTAGDLTSGTEVNANTDWTVADRVVKSLDDCSLGYKEAIQACLDTPLVPAAQRVSLDDELTRTGLFYNVVQPLEGELQHLFREKF